MRHKPVFPLVVLALVAASAPFSSSTHAAGGNAIIGAPQASPRQPVPGKSIRVAFTVRDAAGRRVSNAVLIFSATVAGHAVQHTDSFSTGVAKTTIRVPRNAGGKALKITLTAHTNGLTARRSVQYSVRAAPKPALAIEDASVSEGNAGSSVLNFPVTLSFASATRVSVSYATSDGTANAPGDYAATQGRSVFAPGETTKTLSVAIKADTLVEEDETLDVTLSKPVGARLVRDTGIGTIVNDDVPATATAGNYQGATPEGIYVFLSVLQDRTVTGFRANSLTLNCNLPGYLQGSISWGDQTFKVGDDGTFSGQGSWAGSDVEGDVEYTATAWTVKGTFTNATTVTGSIYLSNELNYNNHHYVCSSTTTYTATLQP